MSVPYNYETLVAMRNCVSREIGMRKRVYPRWVQNGKMNQEVADYELETMEGVLQLIDWLIEEEQ